MTLEQSKLNTIEDHFVVRPALLDDAEAVAELFTLNNKAAYGADGEVDDAEDIRLDWQMPNFNLEASTRLVETRDGQLVGYAEVWDTAELPVRPRMGLDIHPDYYDTGIGSYLAAWGEQRARAVFDRVPADARIVLDSTASSKSQETRAILQAAGLTPTGESWWRMGIVMDSPPPAPQLPEGLVMKTYADFPQPEAIYRARTDSFRDHRGFVEESFETGFQRWSYFMLDDDLLDPSLWFLALDSDTIAGISLNRWELWGKPEAGYVMTLGVIPQYRRRGLGEALLLQTFQEFWRRGKKHVTLHVDGSSLTGATRLYERAGMTVEREYNRFEKELRPGVEMSRQTL